MTVVAQRETTFGPVVVGWDERTLEPRPWTLAQSRWAAEVAEHAPPGPLLELCAGVGHIGLAAAVLAGRDLVQIERDEVAASHARANVTRNGLDGRVEVRCCDLATGLGEDERYPVVIADPPYLTPEQAAAFPDDPEHAVHGGEDGLDVVRACLAVAAEHLAPGGSLVLQVGGPGQAAAAVGLAAPDLRAVATRVAGRDRALLLLCRPPA